jgi:hypothetical protein
MRTTTLSVRELAEYLRRLVLGENLRLIKSWRERLHELGQRCDLWAAQALSGEFGPRISRLLVKIPCFERLPCRSLFRKAGVPAAFRPRLTLGSPGFLLRWLGLYRPHTLCIEVFNPGEDAAIRVFLSESHPTSSENNTKGEEHE